MANDLQHIWQADGAAQTFTNPEDFMHRSGQFERRIRRRNILEYAAGVFIFAIAAPAAVAFAIDGMTGMAISMVLMMIGTAIALWNLHARASAERRRPEEDCRTHLVAQYRRQADALRKVPLWYIGPLLPSVLGVYGTVAARAIGERPAMEIIANLGVPFAATLAFFGFVIWLNLRAARALERELKTLEAA